MRLRTPAAVAALATALLPGPAHALICPMLTDPVDYQVVLGQHVPLPAGSVDIASADLASGATTVSVVLRLRSLDPAPAVDALGPRWTVAWDIDSSTYAAELRRTALGTEIAVFHGGGGSTAVTAAVDPAAHSITWTIPRGLMPELATPKRTFRGLRAFTSVAGTSADTAFTSLAYVDQTAGCVPAS